MSFKKCLGCQATLINPHFNRKRCPKCAEIVAKISTAKSVKVWKATNPDKVKALNKSWTDRFPLKRRFTHAKDIAKTRELSFDLTRDQLTNLWNQPCHYCNKPINEETGVGLDRINNNLGYAINNVLPCCGDCNYIRGNHLTVEEMEIAMKAVLEFRKSKMIGEDKC